MLVLIVFKCMTAILEFQLLGKMEALLNLRSLWDNRIEIEKFRLNRVSFHSEVDSLGNKPRFYPKAKNSENSRLQKVLIRSQDLSLIHI